MRKCISYIAFFCAVFFCACVSKDKVPSSVMQPEKMKSVLWDVMRAQFMAIEMVKKDSLSNKTAETKALTQKVFKIHKITEADFDKSYNWYVKHPDVMRVIFDSLYTQKQRDRNDEHGQERLQLPIKGKIIKNEQSF